MIVRSMSKYSQICGNIVANPQSFAGFNESRSPTGGLKCGAASLAPAGKVERQDG